MKGDVFFQPPDFLEERCWISGVTNRPAKPGSLTYSGKGRKNLKMEFGLVLRDDEGHNHIHRNTVQGLEIKGLRKPQDENGRGFGFSTDGMGDPDAPADAGAHGLFPFFHAFIKHFGIFDDTPRGEGLGHEPEECLFVGQWDIEKYPFDMKEIKNLHVEQNIRVFDESQKIYITACGAGCAPGPPRPPTPGTRWRRLAAKVANMSNMASVFYEILKNL